MTTDRLTDPLLLTAHTTAACCWMVESEKATLRWTIRPTVGFIWRTFACDLDGLQVVDEISPKMIDVFLMFEPKRASAAPLANYIGARVTDTEEAWLRTEMKRRKLTMSDLLRFALQQLRGKS